jgi:hypothetical protein
VENLRRTGIALASAGESRRLAELVPVFLGSVLVALLVAAAAPSSTAWTFQSPVSPFTPAPGVSPVAPPATATAPALVAVPAASDFVPWLVGILVVAAIVGAATLWSRRSGKGGVTRE